MKVIYLIIAGIFLISLVSANQQTLGVFKQGDCVELLQLCSSCSYVNILSVTYPNTSSGVINSAMTKNGGRYNYTFCDTWLLGNYIVNGIGDVDATDTVFAYDFEITPSGNAGTSSNIALFLIAILLVYGIAFFGLFGRNVVLTILGGMSMLILGIYLFNNGIIIYRDDITRTISYITIGIGAVFAIWGSYEWYQDM
jgi:hypothetical protein